MTRSHRPRALVALALAAASVTAGCSVTNPQTTQLQYAPGDGVEARLGQDVTVASVLFVAAGEDSPGTLIARVVNDGTEPVTVQITGDDVDVSVDVAPGETYEIGPEGDEEVVVDPIGAVPGTTIPLTVALEGTDASEQIRPTVLDGTLEEYADLVPTSSPTTS